MGQIGIITEQGDLGFGYDKLNDKDTKIYNEAMNRNNNNNNIKIINESKKDK